jgi:hypothetical protein
VLVEVWVMVDVFCIWMVVVVFCIAFRPPCGASPPRPPWWFRPAPALAP